MHISRRAIFAAVPAFAIAACTSTTQTPSQIAADAQSILVGLQSAANVLAAGGQIPAARLAQMQAALTVAENAAAALSSAVTAADGKTAGQQLVIGFNALAAVAAATPGLPPAFTTYLAAASVLVPIIAAQLDVKMPVAAAKGAPKMSVAQARLLLRS